MYGPENKSQWKRVITWAPLKYLSDMWSKLHRVSFCRPSICIRYENTTAAMLDEALLSLFVSDSEDKEFSGFSADSDNE